MSILFSAIPLTAGAFFPESISITFSKTFFCTIFKVDSLTGTPLLFTALFIVPSSFRVIVVRPILKGSIILILLVLLGLTLGIMWLFYQLLYGFLLKKLNTNYKELAKLDTNS